MTGQLWQGEWIDDEQAGRRLEELARTGAVPPADPLDPWLVIDACAAVGRALSGGGGGLAGSWTGGPHAHPGEGAALRELASFLHPDRLGRTLRAELGERPRPGAPGPDGVAEGWQPLGLLAHVIPANVAAAGPVSLVEGLLSGNVNVLKTSARRGPLTQRFAAALVAAQPRLAPYTIVLGFGSARRDWLRWMCRPADGVVVWGSEEAVAGIGDLVPAGARLIAWGPKISFGYLTRDAWRDRGVLAALAHDICADDQQACTSPQVVYVDTAREEDLWAAAAGLAEVLGEVDAGYPAPEPDLDERAEITNTVLVARHEQHLGLARVWAGPEQRWHVIAETSPALRASPLYRTVWVKPLPRDAIVATLHPMRRYLSTAGIHVPDAGLPGLVPALFASGVDRVTPIGSMREAYPGEPHDGQYALRRYSRRVSLRVAGV